MKILLLADERSKRLKELLEQKPDIIFTLGDLESWMVPEIADVDIPKFGIFGNHENDDFFEKTGVKNIHLQSYEFQKMNIVGFQGCVRYKDRSLRTLYTQEEATDLIQDLPPSDILIAHCPPRGIHDSNDLSGQGFEGLLAYIKKYSPKYVFHGHTYPENVETDNLLISEIDGVRVVWSYGANIIEI